MSSDKIEVPRALLQAIINYLVERPYKDVAQLIRAIAEAEQTQEEGD